MQSRKKTQWKKAVSFIHLAMRLYECIYLYAEKNPSQHLQAIKAITTKNSPNLVGGCRVSSRQSNITYTFCPHCLTQNSRYFLCLWLVHIWISTSVGLNFCCYSVCLEVGPDGLELIQTCSFATGENCLCLVFRCFASMPLCFLLNIRYRHVSTDHNPSENYGRNPALLTANLQSENVHEQCAILFFT